MHELLSQGPLLTGNPEAVGPESWADLLAAGRGAGGAAGAAPAAAPATARRLSNPAQEASNFAAEGLAADADVLTVHQVLVQRLAASGAALQAAGQSGAVPSTADMRTALAEAAAYRGAWPCYNSRCAAWVGPQGTRCSTPACHVASGFGAAAAFPCIMALHCVACADSGVWRSPPASPVICCLPCLLQKPSCSACVRSWQQPRSEQRGKHPAAAAAPSPRFCSFHSLACLPATPFWRACKQRRRQQQQQGPQILPAGAVAGQPLLRKQCEHCGAACGSVRRAAALAAAHWWRVKQIQKRQGRWLTKQRPQQ